MIGKVKFFNTAKGYGFIAPEGGGNDAFVTLAEVKKAGLTELFADQRVSYDQMDDKRGKMYAGNLRAEH